MIMFNIIKWPVFQTQKKNQTFTIKRRYLHLIPFIFAYQIVFDNFLFPEYSEEHTAVRKWTSSTEMEEKHSNKDSAPFSANCREAGKCQTSEMGSSENFFEKWRAEVLFYLIELTFVPKIRGGWLKYQHSSVFWEKNVLWLSILSFWNIDRTF